MVSEKSTREAILCLRIITEKMFRINKPLFIAFDDLEKAFDNVNWAKLFKIIEAIGIGYINRKIIHNLYINDISVIKPGKVNNQVEAEIA